MKTVDLTETLNTSVEEVEAKVGYEFSEDEVLDVLAYTVRKCEINGKGEDYIPILFENELRDFVMREAINYFGYLNRLKKMAAQEAVANV